MVMSHDMWYLNVYKVPATTPDVNIMIGSILILTSKRYYVYVHNGVLQHEIQCTAAAADNRSYEVESEKKHKKKTIFAATMTALLTY